jgi:hypothetical protein
MQGKTGDRASVGMHLRLQITIDIEDFDSSISKTKNDLLLPEYRGCGTDCIALSRLQVLACGDAEDSCVACCAVCYYQVTCAVDGEGLDVIDALLRWVGDGLFLNVKSLDNVGRCPVFRHRAFPTRLRKPESD